MRAYEASKKEMELVELMNETWQSLEDRYYPVEEALTSK